MSRKARLGRQTRAIHAGQQYDPSTGAIMPPIYTSSTYVQSSPGMHKGFEYSRTQNPTRQAYERAVADMENGHRGFAFSSGMAATSTILELLDSGAHIIAMDDIYGGSYRLFNQVRKRSSGLQFSFTDLSDDEKLLDAMRDNTGMIWIETPTNPMLRLVDLTKMVSFAKKHGLLTVVDNTFASPYLQNPLDYGCNVVMHSSTKYINGHSDIIGGVAVVKCKELADELGFLQKSVGAVQGAFDSYLALRGLKTLPLRMEASCNNAMKLAQWLDTDPRIERVIYPGLPTHPDHELAQKQMRGFGAIISLLIKGGASPAKKMLENCKIFALAESLGGIESLINLPSKMTHASIPLKERQRIGIHDNLVRLSVGIENFEDLKYDLDQALN